VKFFTWRERRKRRARRDAGGNSAFAVTTIHLHFLPSVQMAVEDGNPPASPPPLTRVPLAAFANEKLARMA
jgi:hypothetical protein